MRAEGATLDAIGEHFGVVREYIRELVGTTSLPPADCGWCGVRLPDRRAASTRYCSRPCAKQAQRRAARAVLPPCPQCGKPKSVAGRVCRLCRHANISVENDNALLVELWARGESISTIAAALDTTTNTLGVRIHRMRGQGYDLPYRRRVFLNGEPVYPDLEVREHQPAQVPLLSLNTKEILSRLGRREQMRARRIFHSAEERGEVVRPDTCSRCGERTRIEAHHADYSKPLEVEWLCFPCHRSLHVEQAAA